MIFLTRSRRLLGLSVLLFGAVGACLGTGRLVTREDPLQHADAIYVLGGSWVQRWFEAVDLYTEGYAPTIVLSPGGSDPAQATLERRGIHIPGSAELGRNAMVGQLGIPANAVELLPGGVDNTAQEAEAIKTIATARGWHRLIVITDRPNTRRAGYAMRRVLGPDVNIIVRASRHDTFDPARWWTPRPSFRAVFYEAPKLLAYWLGLKG